MIEWATLETSPWKARTMCMCLSLLSTAALHCSHQKSLDEDRFDCMVTDSWECIDLTKLMMFNAGETKKTRIPKLKLQQQPHSLTFCTTGPAAFRALPFPQPSRQCRAALSAVQETGVASHSARACCRLVGLPGKAQSGEWMNGVKTGAECAYKSVLLSLLDSTCCPFRYPPFIESLIHPSHQTQCNRDVVIVDKCCQVCQKTH